MKRAILGCVVALATMGLGATDADAGGIRFSFGFGRGHHGHHGHHHGHHRFHSSGYRSPWGVRGYGHGHGHSHWHDTSHWDYHPGYYIRHYDHYDYVPGHYHWHNTGHWDHH